MLTCGSCGVTDDSVQTCTSCKTEKRYTNVCTRCRATHEPACEDIQKKLKRGQGPTVVRTTYAYIPPPAEGVEQGLAGIADLLKGE